MRWSLRSPLREWRGSLEQISLAEANLGVFVPTMSSWKSSFDVQARLNRQTMSEVSRHDRLADILPQHRICCLGTIV